MGRTLKPALWAACCAAGALIACEQPSPVSFEVDAQGVLYTYRGPNGQQTVRSLEQVPLSQRAAILVHVVGQTDAEQKYLVDLLESEPGQRATGRPITIEQYQAHTFAAGQAGWLADFVALNAEERAKLDPNSERSRQSRKTRMLLDDLVSRETSENP